jgi:hypothetical protein
MLIAIYASESIATICWFAYHDGRHKAEFLQSCLAREEGAGVGKEWGVDTIASGALYRQQGVERE